MFIFAIEKNRTCRSSSASVRRFDVDDTVFMLIHRIWYALRDGESWLKPFWSIVHILYVLLYTIIHIPCTALNTYVVYAAVIFGICWYTLCSLTHKLCCVILLSRGVYVPATYLHWIGPSPEKLTHANTSSTQILSSHNICTCTNGRGGVLAARQTIFERVCGTHHNAKHWYIIYETIPHEKQAHHSHNSLQSAKMCLYVLLPACILNYYVASAAERSFCVCTFGCWSRFDIIMFVVIFLSLCATSRRRRRRRRRREDINVLYTRAAHRSITFVLHTIFRCVTYAECCFSGRVRCFLNETRQQSRLRIL